MFTLINVRYLKINRISNQSPLEFPINAFLSVYLLYFIRKPNKQQYLVKLFLSTNIHNHSVTLRIYLKRHISNNFERKLIIYFLLVYICTIKFMSLKSFNDRFHCEQRLQHDIMFDTKPIQMKNNSTSK